MKRFHLPSPKPLLAALTLEEPAGPEEVLRDEEERRALQGRITSLPREQALTHWRASLAGGRVHAGSIVAHLHPEELREVWKETPHEAWAMGNDEARFIVLTLGEEALAGMRTLASHGVVGGGGLLDVRASWVAMAMARSLVGLSTVALPIDAYRWLVKHEDIACDALVHGALTGEENTRRAALHALRWLAKRHGGARVREAAQARGALSLRAIEEVLAPDYATHPLFARPLPKALASFDPVQLKTGEALDAASMEAMVRMVATPLPLEHPALREVFELCDPESLRALGKQLFAMWTEGGMATQNQWIATAHAMLGGDEALRSLGRAARAWTRSKETHEKRAARLAIEVLGAVASDVAIAEIASIASTSRDALTVERAMQTLARIALERDTDVDELGAPADVPVLTLDYGTRQFTTRLSPSLKLVLHDGERLLDELPRPTKKDDAAKAKHAKELFQEARDAVRDAVKSEARRLEHAMTNEVLWSLQRFRERVAPASIPWFVAQRVLWHAETEGSFRFFRIDEEGAFVGEDDSPFASGDASIGVAHPLHLCASALAQWQQTFADYALLVPFAQLDRSVHLAWPSEARTLYPGAVMGLREKGWQLLREASSEITTLQRTWPGGVLRVEIEPGIRPDRLAESPPQTIQRTHMSRGALSAIALSESLRELFGDA